MLNWIYEKSLLKFVSDKVMEFLIFLKYVKYKFTNLSLSLKYLNNKI